MFQSVGNPIQKVSGRDFGFGLSIVTTDVRVETDELVYPFNSFVAEFGGDGALSWILFSYDLGCCV